ncbi:hypothetical protein BC829DRAFT_438297 [Chytridium lagenaria]|nr:hypothetical protein BC829DRAFT_438297 [Chytridium lagenaria]
MKALLEYAGCDRESMLKIDGIFFFFKMVFKAYRRRRSGDLSNSQLPLVKGLEVVIQWLRTVVQKGKNDCGQEGEEDSCLSGGKVGGRLSKREGRTAVHGISAFTVGSIALTAIVLRIRATKGDQQRVRVHSRTGVDSGKGFIVRRISFSLDGVDFPMRKCLLNWVVVTLNEITDNLVEVEMIFFGAKDGWMSKWTKDVINMRGRARFADVLFRSLIYRRIKVSSKMVKG